MIRCKNNLHDYDTTFAQCPFCKKIASVLYYHKNKEHIISRLRTWAKENREKVRVYKSDWKRENIGKVNAATRKRQAAKLQRTPKWLTKEQLDEIQEWYSNAADCQWLSNEKLCVDHIIPLQGKNVSGLHVPWNLQILTFRENSKKHNRFL